VRPDSSKPLSMPPIRMGILGAARIAPAAVIRPARAVPEVTVDALSARDPARARTFADKHGIPRVLPDYRAIVEDPDIDAVYVPLPNGLHGYWTKAALAAGKHVLCEKPFTANAEEAVEVQAAALNAPTLVVMEAFHYRYHPLFGRALELLADGAVGTVRRIQTWMCFPLPLFKDIRWQLALAGGSTMDAGCYAVHMARHLAGSEPRVTSARCRLRSPGVDRLMQAELDFGDGCTGQITTSMWSSHVMHVGFTVQGDAGELRAFNPASPQHYHRLVLRRKRRTVEHATRRPTYEFQMEAFAGAVLRGVAPITGTADALSNMKVIDAVYRAAGLEPRQPTPVPR
jgi:predicted dehydrogenase